MKNIEVAGFVRKLTDEELNSFIYKVSKLQSINVEVRDENGKITGFKRQMRHRRKLDVKDSFYEQINALKVDYIALLKKFQLLKMIKSIKISNYVDVLYDDLRKLEEFKSYSDIYPEDGIDSFARNMEDIESYYESSDKPMTKDFHI